MEYSPCSCGLTHFRLGLSLSTPADQDLHFFTIQYFSQYSILLRVAYYYWFIKHVKPWQRICYSLKNHNWKSDRKDSDQPVPIDGGQLNENGLIAY